MRRFIVVSLGAMLAVASGIANADVPVRVAPQFGIYFTKSFGGQQSVPLEMGAKFHYGDVNADIYHRHSKRYRPALFDVRFNSTGVTAFETAGVSVLQPQYLLGAEEGGFFSSINWGLVGISLMAAGIYYAAEEDRDDREERIAKRKKKQEEQAPEEGGEGEEPPPEDGGDGTLCDPSGTLGCSPVDPTAGGGGEEPPPEDGGDGTLCDPSGTLGCSPVDPTADGGGEEPPPEGGGDGTLCDPSGTLGCSPVDPTA